MAVNLNGTCDFDNQSDDGSDLERTHVEPIYDSFVCPLTKKVMHDPVSLETGQTFEREAIEKWFKECKQCGRKLVCPLTLRELRSADLNPSIALRKTIEQWTARNEIAQLDKVRRSLELGSQEDDIIRSLQHVQYISQKSRPSRHAAQNSGLAPMIVHLLKSGSRSVRGKALESLRVVVREDEESKDIFAEGDTVRTIVKFLSTELPAEREEAVSLLYELSKSEALCQKIGSINGAILILVGMTNSKSENISMVEKAEKTLENLEKCDNNVRLMAECGRLQPILTQILQGPPEVQISMAAYLGELALNNDVKVQVAKAVGLSLINIMGSSSMRSREVALKALSQISSFEGSAKVLIEEGILPALVKDLFMVGANQLPMRLKEVSATILANLVNSGYEFDPILVDGHSHHSTLVSEEIVHNLLHLISNTGPAIAHKLLQVLVGLTSYPSTVSIVVSAVRISGATLSLVQFIEAPQHDLRVASIKLLRNIAPHLGQELADALCGVNQLGSLFKIVSESSVIAEDQAAAVGLLAELPERDLGITRQMINEGAFDQVYSTIVRIKKGETRGSRFVTPYLEGLVRVLARITFALSNEPNAVAFCRDYSLASLFIELLQSNGLDNVQMVSAMALENLSLESGRLTRVPERPAPGFWASVFTCVYRKQPPEMSGRMCRLHCGHCSLKQSFCLLEGQAVDKLVALLDHTNDKVVEAALAALSTLLDDGVDIEQGIVVLCDADAVKPIFDVLLQKHTDNLWRRAVWTVERLLRMTDIAIEVSNNPNVGTALVDAFQHGDFQTRQIAEKALKHVDKLPNFSGVFPNAGKD